MPNLSLLILPFLRKIVISLSLRSNQEQFKETDNKKNEKEESESESKDTNMDIDTKTRKRVGAETLDNVPERKKTLRRSFSRQSLSGEGSSANVPLKH